MGWIVLIFAIGLLGMAGLIISAFLWAASVINRIIDHWLGD